MDRLQIEYSELMELQIFDEADMDYSILEKHKRMLTQLANFSNSGITVFDMYKKDHVFTSPNFNDLFGYCEKGIEERVHPDDMWQLMKNGIEAMKFFYSQKDKIKNYKMISEFRIRNASEKYIRVIEQFTLLESDNSGNAWLTLSVLDLSPDQSTFNSVKSHIFNTKENTFFPVLDLYSSNKKIDLTPREVTILELIKKGLLSKEISEQLFISVHTVNTHRQRILEKLDVNNSIEAVTYASKLGLLN